MGLIILVALLAIIIAVLVESCILLWITKLFKTDNPTYKKSLIIVTVSSIASLFGVILGMISLGFLATITTFFVFHFLLRKYYQTTWKKSLGIYVVTGMIGSILVLFTILPVRWYIFEPFVVAGEAMSPTYKNGDYLLINKLDKIFERGDVVALRYPKDPKQFFVKRIIGLPGEKIQIDNSKVIVNDKVLLEPYLNGNAATYPHDTTIIGGQKTITLGQNEYFVLGDNRLASSDSRDWGVLPLSNIWGKISYKISGLLNQFETKNSPNETDTRIEYRNTKYRYSLHYPENFTIYTATDQMKEEVILPTVSSDKVYFTNDKKMLFCCEPLVSSVSVVNGPIDPKNWRQYVNIPDYRIISQGEIIFSGRKAYEVRSSIGIDSAGARLILIPGNEISFILIQGDKGEPWESITNSFNIELLFTP